MRLPSSSHREVDDRCFGLTLVWSEQKRLVPEPTPIKSFLGLRYRLEIGRRRLE